LSAAGVGGTRSTAGWEEEEEEEEEEEAQQPEQQQQQQQVPGNEGGLQGVERRRTRWAR